MGENVAQLILCHLANERRFAAQSRHASQRVGRRTARHFNRGAHQVVQSIRFFSVDQAHTTLKQTFGFNQFITSAGDYINNRITYRQDVKTGGRGHILSYIWGNLGKSP